MWVMTPYGFISAVRKDQDESMLVVRARDFKSLENVCKVLSKKAQKEVYRPNRATDYPYRMDLTKLEMIDYLTQEVQDIDYSNFKNKATAVRGEKYHQVLMKVWVAMLGLTPSRVKERQRREDQAYYTRPTYMSGGGTGWLAQYLAAKDEAVDNWPIEADDFPEDHIEAALVSDLENELGSYGFTVTEYPGIVKHQEKAIHDMTDDEFLRWMEADDETDARLA